MKDPHLITVIWIFISFNISNEIIWHQTLKSFNTKNKKKTEISKDVFNLAAALRPLYSQIIIFCNSHLIRYIQETANVFNRSLQINLRYQA